MHKGKDRIAALSSRVCPQAPSIAPLGLAIAVRDGGLMIDRFNFGREVARLAPGMNPEAGAQGANRERVRPARPGKQKH